METVTIEQIQQKLIEGQEWAMDKDIAYTWAQGYIHGLVEWNVITFEQFTLLLEWINSRA